ncbi:hypothetical protein [Bradyrhizobium murdochi]|nr:hypothetical protein [Bradyrhizobium murdochi]
MVWVILGGGKRLAQIFLGTVALIGLFVMAFASDVGIVTTARWWH